MKDTFFGDANYIWVFNFDLSSASIWDPSKVLTYQGATYPNATRQTARQWKSQGQPKGVEKVVAVSSDNKITVAKKPENYSSRNSIAAQVVFRINARTYERKKSGNGNSLQYIDYNNQAAGRQTYTYGSAKLLQNNQVKNECMNIHIGFCGDGIIDNGSQSSSENLNAKLAGSEVCDPADTTKTNRGNGGCSTTCQPITLEQPACNSTYNGQTFDTLTGSDTLCNPGSITGFTATSTGRTRTCNGQTGTTPANCAATKKTL
jgi:hypothetical protein